MIANNENMKKLSTNDQKWLCHRLFKQVLRSFQQIIIFAFCVNPVHVFLQNRTKNHLGYNLTLGTLFAIFVGWALPTLSRRDPVVTDQLSGNDKKTMGQTSKSYS